LGKGMLGKGMLGKGMLGKGMLGKGIVNHLIPLPSIPLPPSGDIDDSLSIFRAVGLRIHTALFVATAGRVVHPASDACLNPKPVFCDSNVHLSC
ncbi:MAG TPA: hypothetical protein PLF81_07530, partial [Candidatus Anammoximicrobium sp.]|nr:hypothetical protein [Candidatus Anammoximicrobium sp.]